MLRPRRARRSGGTVVVVVVVAVVAAGLLAACDGGGAGDAGDASADATLGDALADAGMDARDARDGAACDAGAAPGMLPMVRSTVVVLGPDAGTARDGGVAFPTPSGGDPVGAWVATHATLYLPPAARDAVDVARSRLEGTAWTVIEPSRLRFGSDLTVALATRALGTVRQELFARSRGAYELRGATLAVTPDCGEGRPALAEVGFSRDAMDRGRVFLPLNGPNGPSLLVLDVARAPGM